MEEFMYSRRFRPFQFSLAGLLIATAIVAVGTAVWRYSTIPDAVTFLLLSHGLFTYLGILFFSNFVVR
jgi:hypothetical protein